MAISERETQRAEPTEVLWVWDFAPVPRSVADVRRRLADALTEAGCEAGMISAAQLAASELATNALLHARTPFSVAIERTGTTIRVIVRDGSKIFPAIRDYGTTAATGRGLGIVASTVTAWEPARW